MCEKRVIVHVDMDAFFAAVEQLDFPEYRGKPVIVGADPRGGKGRGVVSASSYEARRFGIHSALPISKAYALCPSGIFVRPRFHRYSELSEQVMDILHGFSPLVEQISIDEAFLDCSGTEKLFGQPSELGRSIKKKIFESTGLGASVGIAPNKSIAKIASDLEKPDGLTICPPGEERGFMHPLPIKRLWGAGPRTVELLNTRGLRTAGDIAALPVEMLEATFGKHGRHLWELANGIDDRAVYSEYERKSFSEEVTFNSDVESDDFIEQTILGIADSLGRRVRRAAIKGRTVTLKIRLEGFETYTRSHTMPEPVDGMKNLLTAALGLYRKFNRKGKKVRLIGMGISNLTAPDGEEYTQLELFGRNTTESGNDPVPLKNTDEILDRLKERYGEKITRATLLNRDDPRGGNSR